VIFYHLKKIPPFEKERKKEREREREREISAEEQQSAVLL